MPIDRYWVLTARKTAGEATPEELAELAALAALRDEEARTGEMLEKVWDGHTPQPVDAAEEARLLALLGNRLPEFSERAPGRRKMLRPGSVAFIAAVCVGIFAVVFYTLQHRSVSKHEVLADRGSRTKVKLPDGTRVWLNAGSKLTYDDTYSHGERSVQLDGEAFFEVVGQAGTPFEVTAKNVKVQVLGTTFNLKAYKEDDIVETALVTGSVMLHYKSTGSNESTLLKPMEKLVLKADVSTGAYTPQHAPIIVPEKETIKEIAWKDNWLSFDNEPFSDLAVRLGRWYNIRVVFTDDSLRHLTFTGNIQGEGIKDVMDVLSRSSREFVYSYNHVSRVLTISKP